MAMLFSLSACMGVPPTSPCPTLSAHAEQISQGHCYAIDNAYPYINSSFPHSQDTSNPPSHIPLEPGQYQPMTSFTPDQ